jgi:hypothetical protein
MPFNSNRIAAFPPCIFQPSMIAQCNHAMCACELGPELLHETGTHTGSPANTHAGRTVSYHIGLSILRTHLPRGGTELARRNPPRKVTYFDPVPPRLARNTVIEPTFDVGRRFRCTMRVDCGQLDPIF